MGIAKTISPTCASTTLTLCLSLVDCKNLFEFLMQAVRQSGQYALTFSLSLLNDSTHLLGPIPEVSHGPDETFIIPHRD